MPLDLQCTNAEKIRVSVNPTDRHGRPASLDGAVRASVTEGTGTVEPISDREFYAVSGDQPGGSVFQVEADADLGEGVILIQDTVTLNVVSETASNLGLSAGTPEPK